MLSQRNAGKIIRCGPTYVLLVSMAPSTQMRFLPCGLDLRRSCRLHCCCCRPHARLSPHSCLDQQVISCRHCRVHRCARQTHAAASPVVIVVVLCLHHRCRRRRGRPQRACLVRRRHRRLHLPLRHPRPCQSDTRGRAAGIWTHLGRSTNQCGSSGKKQLVCMQCTLRKRVFSAHERELDIIASRHPGAANLRTACIITCA